MLESSDLNLRVSLRISCYLNRTNRSRSILQISIFANLFRPDWFKYSNFNLCESLPVFFEGMRQKKSFQSSDLNLCKSLRISFDLIRRKKSRFNYRIRIHANIYEPFFTKMICQKTGLESFDIILGEYLRLSFYLICTKKTLPNHRIWIFTHLCESVLPWFAPKKAFESWH